MNKVKKPNGLAHSSMTTDPAPKTQFPLRWIPSIPRALLQLIGIGLFIFVLLGVNVDGIFLTLKTAHIPFLLLATVLTAPFFLIKSWRWMRILRNMNIHISWTDSTMLYGAGLFVGQLTPGQLGEMVRAHYLARRGHDSVSSVSSVLVDRFLDLVALLILGVPGFFLFGVAWKVSKTSWIILLSGFSALGLILIMVYLFGAGAGLWRRGLDRMNWLRKFYLILQSAKSLRSVGVLIFSTFLALGLNLSRLYCLLAALGLSLPLLYFVVSMAFVSIVGLLPISVAGIGTRDVALVFVFGGVGLPPEQAVAFSVLILILNQLNLVWGFSAWLAET